jgi:hypothetical protein
MAGECIAELERLRPIRSEDFLRSFQCICDNTPGIGGSLDNTRWRDHMSDWADAGSKVHENFVTLREGIKLARRKAGRER